MHPMQRNSQYDLVVDGSDNFSTRYLVNDTCVKLKKTLVYGSILGFSGQVAVFNHNGSKNLRDMFPNHLLMRIFRIVIAWVF
jgi:adenylyltransferase/sulfurtransferase